MEIKSRIISSKYKKKWLVAIALIIAWQFYTCEPFTALCKGGLLYVFYLCIKYGMEEEHVLNPYYLFATAPFSLLIYDPTVSYVYFVDLKPQTFFLAFMNMLVFVIVLKKTTICKWKEDKFLESKNSLVAHGWLFYILSILANVITPLHNILSFCFYPAVACVAKSKKYTHLLFMFCVTFLLNMDTLNKTTILSMCIVALLSYLKYNKQVKQLSVRNIILFAVLCAVMLASFNLKSYLQDGGGTFMGYINGGYNTNSLADEYYNRTYISWDYSKVLLMPYFYLTTPWVNVQYVMESQPDLTYGLWMLKPLLGWFGLSNNFENYYKLDPYSSFNTFSYITVLFKDFGYWGSCLGSAFLGFFVKRIYEYYKKSSTPLNVACYAAVALATAEMFFSNHFFSLAYPFTVYVMIFIYRRVFSILHNK